MYSKRAHIIPVGHGGTDAVGNGLCMRVDIHRLFDNGKIRIAPDGEVEHLTSKLPHGELSGFTGQCQFAEERWARKRPVEITVSLV